MAPVPRSLHVRSPMNTAVARYRHRTPGSELMTFLIVDRHASFELSTARTGPRQAIWSSRLFRDFEISFTGYLKRQGGENLLRIS